MLEVTNLKKEFKSGDGTVLAVNDISFSIPTGSFASIVGKSGSGKTTLLTLLGGLDKPSSGVVKVDDQIISSLSDRQLIAYRGRKIGFVFQHYYLIPNLTALENVMLPMEFAGVKPIVRKKRAQELLDKVGLHDAKQLRLPGKLSGGEQQRVSIARALSNHPSVIIADEPTGNLDSHTSKKIVELLQELSKKENTTIIVVTHDLNMTQHTDITFQLRDGKLVHQGGQVSQLLS